MRALCWGTGPWGVRRLLGHVKGLPRDSAYSRALRGERAYWDETPELLAQIVDAVERQSFYFRKANFQDAGPVPESLPRPGEVARELPTVSLAEWAGTLQGGTP